MASERQIAANRANAKRSTGPKTVAGKMASSRNALRHGLSSPLQPDPIVSAKVEAIAHALAGANQDLFASAAEFASALLELLRIRATRSELAEHIGQNYNNTRELRRLAALDRYERYCFTKRRRASNKLRERDDVADYAIERANPNSAILPKRTQKASLLTAVATSKNTAVGPEVLEAALENLAMDRTQKERFR